MKVATFILTWDGSESVYPPKEYQGHVAATRRGRTVPLTWSVGSRRGGMSVGDRVFLLRQNSDRGIVGSGRVTDEEVFEDQHWEDSTRTARYVRFAWERLLPIDERLTVDELREQVPSHHWHAILASGQQVYPPADATLETLWLAHVARLSSPSAWDTPVGATLSREHRMVRYGGGKYGGIEPSRSTHNVFLYSDPQAGSLYGYNYDGWSADGTVFLYTGEGRRGHQRMREGNGAILRHQQDGRALRLFVADGIQPDSTAKVQLYLGEFRIDPDEPYLTAEAPDADGYARTVFVFRLRPVGKVLRRDQDASEASDASNKATAEPVPVEAAVTPTGSAEAVPLEALVTNSYAVADSTSGTAVKWEAELVARYCAHLQERGHKCVRYRICPPGELRDLYTDLFDQTENVLYEAKGLASREAIRMAVGQLLDYSRHITTSPTLAVLLPGRPAKDLLDLLQGQEIVCVYEIRQGRYEAV
ncbi:hypothetical protein [Micromonospora sp. NPDC049891]|uniref:hypothetical protein n=1 Tax=Micromonospora sp. NPDC049891 TaxID=3155655 RepID=UPI0033F65FDD